MNLFRLVSPLKYAPDVWVNPTWVVRVTVDYAEVRGKLGERDSVPCSRVHLTDGTSFQDERVPGALVGSLEQHANGAH